MLYEELKHRVAMCQEIANVEGTELGDAIAALCNAAYACQSCGADHEKQLVLLAAENLCREYCLECEQDEYCEEPDSDLNQIPADVFKHFTN